METRRLEFLVELARLGSMREVAEVLGVTTSTVSQQIAALAQEAGTPLVEPVGRRVRLTPAGRRLAGHGVTILAAVDAARRDLDPGAEPAGTVRVAGFATAIRRSLLPLLPDLAASHPRVQLVCAEHEPSEALAMLADDAVDIHGTTLLPNGVALPPRPGRPVARRGEAPPAGRGAERPCCEWRRRRRRARPPSANGRAERRRSSPPTGPGRGTRCRPPRR